MQKRLRRLVGSFILALIAGFTAWLLAARTESFLQRCEALQNAISKSKRESKGGDGYALNMHTSKDHLGLYVCGLVRGLLLILDIKYIDTIGIYWISIRRYLMIYLLSMLSRIVRNSVESSSYHT